MWRKVSHFRKMMVHESKEKNTSSKSITKAGLPGFLNGSKMEFPAGVDDGA
jgi:hypothetical protein